MSYFLIGLVCAGIAVLVIFQLNKVGTTSTKPELWQLMVSDMTEEQMRKQLSRVSKWTLAAAFCAWGLSSFFLVKYMTGGEMNPALWDLEQWGNAGLALLLTAIITAFQYFLYSINQKGAAGVIGVAVVVFFGLFSEISNSMEREGATVRARSEESSVFQATVSAINTTTTSATTATVSPALVKAEADKATALVEIEACERHRSKGQARVDRCLRIERGNLAAAKASIEAIKQSQKEATAANQNHALALVDKANELSFDEGQHFEAIKLIMTWLGIAAIFASFIFSLIIMGTFEYAFHYLSVYAANLKKAIKYLSESQTALTDREPARPEVSETQAALEPIHAKQSANVVAGGAVVAAKPDALKVPERMPFGFAPKDQAGIKAELPTAQKSGGTGINNPVLGKSEEHYNLPLNHPSPARNKPVSTEPEAVKIPDGLYTDWFAAVKSGEVKHSQTPSRSWIQKRVAANQSTKQTFTPKEIAQITKLFVKRAARDGLLMSNPKYTGPRSGVAEYLKA